MADKTSSWQTSTKSWPLFQGYGGSQSTRGRDAVGLQKVLKQGLDTSRICPVPQPFSFAASPSLLCWCHILFYSRPQSMSPTCPHHAHLHLHHSTEIHYHPWPRKHLRERQLEIVEHASYRGQHSLRSLMAWVYN